MTVSSSDDNSNNQPKSGSKPLAPPSFGERLQHNKKSLSIVLACLAVLIGFVTYTVNRTHDEPVQAVSSSTALVTLTDKGFSPETLYVAPGTQITWSNDTKTEHQIAADPHPSHSSAGLKDEKPLNPGDSYSYTFEKSGTYHYHDEQHPLDFHGTVIVR